MGQLLTTVYTYTGLSSSKASDGSTVFTDSGTKIFNPSPQPPDTVPPPLVIPAPEPVTEILNLIPPPEPTSHMMDVYTASAVDILMTPPAPSAHVPLSRKKSMGSVAPDI